MIYTIINIIPISWLDKNTKGGLISGIILSIIYMLFVLFIWLIPAIKKRKLFKKLKVGGAYIIISLLVYMIGLKSITSTTGRIDIIYDEAGIVEICQQSTEWPNIVVSIYTINDNVLIWEKQLDSHDLLKAKENISVGSSNREQGIKSKGIIVSSEVLYSYYKMDMDNIINEDGEYCIEIVFDQRKETVRIINSFMYNGIYTYAKKNISKEI